MKTTHIKNIVIWALVAINAFLLAYWLLGLAADYGKTAETHRNLAALLERSGVTLDMRGIREDGELYTLEAYRNTDKEQAMAAALLGTTDRTVQGNTYTYTGKTGQAVFSSGGELQMTFSPGLAMSTPNPVAVSRQYLRLLKIEAKIESSESGTDSDGYNGVETVTAIGIWYGRSIYNYRIQFIFKDGVLDTIKGKYVADISATAVKTDMSSCATAVLSFLAAVRSGQFDCAEIVSVEPGYQLTVALNGDARLEPVWRITADTGEFYVNPADGKTEQAATYQNKGEEA